MRTETLGTALYGLSAVFLGLMVLEARSALKMDWVPVPRGKELSALLLELQRRGKSMQPERESWSYASSTHAWWKLIQTANWVGRRKAVETEERVEEKPPEKPKPPVKPLSEIIEPRVLLGWPGADAYVKVLYVDPNVSPPEGGAAESVGSAAAAVPGGPMGDELSVFQDLRVGDSLYKPYDAIRFEGVTEGGLGVVFSRPAPEGGGKRIEEVLTLGEFSMSGEAFADLPAEMRGGGGGVSPRKSARTAGAKIAWKDPGETTRRLEGNVWMVSRRDTQRFREDYDTLLQEAQAEDYVDWWRDPKNPGQRIKVQGVSIRRVPKALRSFGVQAGDILIEVNGVPVKGRASAIKVGRAQWRRGVRTFELTFLSRGRRIVRTFRAPDK